MARKKSELNQLLEEHDRDLRESSPSRRQDDEGEPEFDGETEEVEKVDEDGRGEIFVGDEDEGEEL